MKPEVVIALGFILAVTGGILAILGTTSSALFILYGVMLVAGLGIASYGKKMRDRR